jgi:hypothetical protein
MAVTYKERCRRCKKNYVTVTWKDRYPVCYECQKSDLDGEIKNKAMKKMFDIPDEFYAKNNLLRSIKIYYLSYGKITEKQIEAFKKVAAKLKKESAPQKKD